MRHLLLIGCLFLLTVSLSGQPNSNPFELRDRLPEIIDSTVVVEESSNPFDIRPAGSGQPGPATSTDPGNANSEAPSAPIVILPTDPDEGRGAILSIHLLMLLMLASLWVLFRDLLSQCLVSTVNDNMMTQLYRRRSGGQVGALWLCYLLFLVAQGFYIYLFALHHDVSLRLGVWASWITYTLAVAAAVGLKHFVLLLFGRIYPVRKELSRYAFVLMVFSILAGLLLVPLNLLISYAPEAWHETFLYGGLFMLAAIYLLHLLRGLFIANRYLVSRPVHFLLYICTIELTPLLLVYRYLSNSLV